VIRSRDKVAKKELLADIFWCKPRVLCGSEVTTAQVKAPCATASSLRHKPDA
jgi:hypothetical protein